MTRVLVDTNVVLDVLLDRQPHAEVSAAVWAAIEEGHAEGYLAAHSITTIHSLIQKQKSTLKPKQVVSLMLRVFRVAAVDAAVIEHALRLPLPDFEDAVTAAAAEISGCDFIVTRDPRGFRGASARTLAPRAALPLLEMR
jgi:predicted nucleic acid-binding protein